MVYASQQDAIVQWCVDEIQYTHIIRLSGYEYWYKEDKLHRLDGPAVTYTDGTEYYFIDGKEIPKEEFYLIAFAFHKKT